MNCQYGRDAYCAGSVVVALLQIPRGSNSIQRDSVVLAQALGTITVDNKWIKSSRIPFVQTPQYPMDQSMTIPPLPSPNTHCFFITPREVLSTTLLNDGGVFLLFDLPIDVIPSHKGLACSISYNIAITVQTPGEPNKQTKFPFSVLGHGSSATIPYEIRCSSLAVFGSGAVPTENALLCPIEDEESDDVDRQTGSFLGQLFNIRDREFVCSLSMMSQLHQLHPGSDLCISLSFEGCVQRCFSVRAYLQQCENRSDGSRVQDKVIVESSRATLSACLVHLNLHLPETISSSFSSPLVKVRECEYECE